MALGEVLAPATGFFSGALAKLGKYWWVLGIALLLAIVIAIVFFIKMNKQRKEQWTHTLIIKRVLPGNMLSEPIIHKMRRFPLVKNAEVFELEKPVLGSYLIPEPGSYSGLNTYSLILDNDNRIWRVEAEYFDKSKDSINVSSRHAEIDLQVGTLKADWQNINKVSKRVDWMQMAKYALTAILIIAVMVIAIVGIGEWGDAQQAKADADGSFASAMNSLSESLETNLETANTNVLILDKLNELYDTRNIQNVIRSAKNGTT